MTDEWLTNYTYDAAGNLTLSAGSGVPSTTRADTYNATQQLVTSFTRTGQHLTSRIQTTTDTRYDALGRRIWIKKVSQCSGTPEDTQHFCRTSYVRRTAWDGDQEIAEFQGGEEDSGTLACGTPRPMQQGLPSEDECPLWGQTLYVHGAALDAPLAVVRSNYREYQYVNPQWILRTFPTFALYPLWNARGEPDLATSITGKNTVCVTTDTPPCAQDFGWPAGMTPYMQQQWVKLSWLGSLLDNQARRWARKRADVPSQSVRRRAHRAVHAAGSDRAGGGTQCARRCQRRSRQLLRSVRAPRLPAALRPHESGQGQLWANIKSDGGRDCCGFVSSRHVRADRRACSLWPADTHRSRCASGGKCRCSGWTNRKDRPGVGEQWS